MALQRPVAATFRVSQPFGGHYYMESPGYLDTDSKGAKRGKKTKFGDAKYFTDLHLGIDYACPIGTAVRAVESGKVVAAGTYDETGEHYMILLIHRDDTHKVVAFYTHLSRFNVPVGKVVEKGTIIARSGNSGMSSGPHLHFELRVGPVENIVYSHRWMRWNAARFMGSGDLINSPLIKPNI
jgi:murein DD-endopeptidase MepM/ murein hydrolase activator NlpD